MIGGDPCVKFTAPSASILKMVGFAIVIVPVCLYVYREVTRDVLVVDPFTVPKSLKKWVSRRTCWQGLRGAVGVAESRSSPAGGPDVATLRDRLFAMQYRYPHHAASHGQVGRNLEPALATSVDLATRVTKRCAARSYAYTAVSATLTAANDFLPGRNPRLAMNSVTLQFAGIAI